MLDDLDRDRQIRRDAFHEGMSTPAAVLAIAAILGLGMFLDFLERKVEVQPDRPPAAQVVGEAIGSYVGDGIKPREALLPLTHPICGLERQQYVKQWGGGTPAKYDCINADNTSRRYP